MEDDYWPGLYFDGQQDVEYRDILYVSENESNVGEKHMNYDEEMVNVGSKPSSEIDVVTQAASSEIDVVTQADKITYQNDKEAEKDDQFAHINLQESLHKVTAETLEDLEKLYSRHAAALGFTVRKGTERTRSGIKSEKYLHCACAGKSLRVPTPVVVKVGENGRRRGWRRKVPITRTDCKAHIRIKLDKKKNYWEVVGHVVEHNHPLTRPEWHYLNRSERAITVEQGEAIKTFENAGLKPSAAYKVMVEQAGGVEKVGFTKKDLLNYVNRLRMQNLAGGDVQKVVEELAQMDEDEPNFYYRVLLDEEGKLAAIFWRDAMMKEDYLLYGDVVVFDTTYNTNRYNLICGPFVGVNNHWSNVMFACAFICNEKTETFAWVLEKFKKSMGGKVPITIFTDQDAAISAAIAQVFKDETRHRLCLWHILQNASGHFGELKSNEEFNDQFKHCLMGCVNEVEFEDCWKMMIEKCRLENHSWLNVLYGLKDKWCPALSKDFFSAGFLSSQRSESTNHAICFDTTRNTSLHAFFKIFQSTVNGWRNTEIENEHRCSRSMPVASLKNGLLTHAAENYTLEIFQFFQDEFKRSVATTVHFDINEWTVDTKIFSIAPEEDIRMVEKVIITNDNGNIKVNCSCKHFEEVGWLCFHALRVLHTCNVTEIPKGYIRLRWTKFAKSEVWDANGNKEHPSANASAPDVITWKQQMARKCNVLLMQSQVNVEARKLIEEVIDNVSLAVREIMAAELEEGCNSTEGANTTVTASSYVHSTNVPEVGDPAIKQKKGRPKNQTKPTNKFDRRKKLRPDDYEFGSTTPNVKLC